jgi:uncharacterized protein YndB with AHSA1/START domain
MPGKTERLKFKQRIAAPLDEVSSMFTNSTALCEWLCDTAQADAHPGGHLYLWWGSGYFVNGEYQEITPGEKVVFSWHGAGEPGATQVKLTLKRQSKGTGLLLQHQGIGVDNAWKKVRKGFKSDWTHALENLKSVMETGQDLRILNKPRLGFCSLQEMSAKQAATAGYPKRPGLLVQGVEPDLCASKAGLQTGDLLVKFAGQKLSSLTDLGSALQKYRSGDKVNFLFYRGEQKMSAKAKLSHHPALEIPLKAENLAEVVGRLYDHFAVELDNLLKGASDEQADYRKDAEEWSIKDVLAHLIATERELHAWIARQVEGQEADISLRANQPVRIRAIISSFPLLSSLTAELKRNQSETVAMASELPEAFVQRRRSYWRVGYLLMQLATMHLPNHLAQMQATLEHARHSTGQAQPEPKADYRPENEAQTQAQKWYEI